MTAVAPPFRRGACPALGAPMQTGDGLLVRLVASGVDIGLDQAAALCIAARRHGNGIIEVTARGSIQVRGLTSASASGFADAVAALGLDLGSDVPILTDPLAGLAPPPAVDGREIAVRLRRALAAAPFAASLGPKVSVVVDGGFALHLDAVAADVRLRPNGERWQVAVGGNADAASLLGWVDAADAVEATLRLLRLIAQRGPSARAKDLFGSHLTGIADLIVEGEPPAARPPAEPMGPHPLHDGSLALGIGVAFGHTDADALAQLIEAAREAGARALRTAPARALLFVGLTAKTLPLLVAAAERLGFITRRDDPRRHVVACAGAPICAAAEIPTRALAPLVSAAAAPLLDGSLTLHLSGCRKGCAHPAPSALTVVGSDRGCALVINDTAGGATHAAVAAAELSTALRRIARAVEQAGGGAPASAALARLAPSQIADLFGAAPHG